MTTADSESAEDQALAQWLGGGRFPAAPERITQACSHTVGVSVFRFLPPCAVFLYVYVFIILKFLEFVRFTFQFLSESS